MCIIDVSHSLPTEIPKCPPTPKTPRTPGGGKHPRFYPVVKEATTATIDPQVCFREIEERMFSNLFTDLRSKKC